MIVDCAIYHGGTRQTVEGDLSDALDRAREHPDGFLWIGLLEPTQDELALIADEFKLHPLAVEDAVHAHQRPKLERYEHTLFVVLKTLRYIEKTSDIEVGEIMVFLGDRFVVTVRHGVGNPLNGVRRRMDKADSELVRFGPSGVMYAVFDEVVDTYDTISLEVEADIIDLENRVFSSERTSDAAAIYALKREVLEFRRAVQPLIPVMREIVSGAVPELAEETLPYFRDVADHVIRVTGTLDSDNELLTSVLNANLAQVSVRMNEDMRKISAAAAIVAVPTMIAGIYGMNFDHMPELRWTFGYPLALVVMGTICYVLYRLFRRSGWL
ncbi:magnesium/cobalt transporter CorA [Bailinhaonella thermotolerans]|uniref:Magnesium transport protein CorA n=1 Tax=Bailinhaonella thermotolerans TaxID=1070861 RepID=A0A3A4BAT3_9ACTN|nr:magnesium/cobalt transporter CorA [Bailinhaonella thermotolerans]RJL36039.1 magnesium and cobalt transport protein CorA [Bailinhaonella thermotolerans]